ncbi:MAG: anti-sigma factor domain-containing protein [Candidatus Limnocylindria bacterium]
MTERIRLDCEAVDELATAYALGAAEPADDRAISEHLSACAKPHAEARNLIDAAAVVPASLEPVAPSAGLRGRILATVAATPQEHAPAPVSTRERVREPRRAWWQVGPLPATVAAVALAAAVGLGAWGLTLNDQLADRDAALRAVAAADAIHAADGPAGSGWVIESGGQAMFMAEDLADLPAGRLYELWLIDADGTAIPTGTLTETDGVALVTLEHSLGSASVFAVTVEAERVDAPTSDPVITAALEG